VNKRHGHVQLAGTWEPNEAESTAAWEMYLELATRISTQPLKHDEGILREELVSLDELFQATREIFRRHGPGVGRKSGSGEYCFTELAVCVLNHGLRPVLAKWHPLLADYEAGRAADVSAVEHEDAWKQASELRTALEQLRTDLIVYANVLAEAARVEPLITLDERDGVEG
jgi:hypothetical protein